MARDIIPIINRGTVGYTTDRGTTILGLTSKFAKPADITDAQIDTILTDAGFSRKTPSDTTPCPVSKGFKPRRLTFVRQDGNSLSFPLVDVAQLRNTATLIRDGINGATPTNQVICITLDGEKWDDLKLELATTNPALAPGTASRVPNTRGKQAQYTGKIQYSYHGQAVGGTATQTLSVKVDTDIVSAAGVPGIPTIVNTIWAGCVGAFDLANPCPSNSDIKPRRYTPTFLVGTAPDTFYQQTIVPVRNSVAADILTCGQNIANLAATVCLEYNGESNDRVHVLL